MGLLTAEEFLATTGGTHDSLPVDAEPPFDFWPYFDAIPEEHFGGHDFSEGRVPYAWKTREEHFIHVNISCPTPNVFLVLVLDTAAGEVKGHHLLDLNELYGLYEDVEHEDSAQ